MTDDITRKAQQVLALAQEAGAMIATAESCTGGMVGAALTAIPGSSASYERGVITYSNAAKVELLGVQQTTLDAHGAVSEPIALEMARGLLERSPATITVSVTGIAGPGGSEFKPEGMVCFGIASLGHPGEAVTIQFGAPGRGTVRDRAMTHALDMLATRLALMARNGNG